ncbi:MAG: nickel transporter permease [Anaerolineae bacterium]
MTTDLQQKAVQPLQFSTPTEHGLAHLGPATPGRATIRRTFMHNPTALVGGTILVLLTLAAFLGPWITPYSPTAIDLRNVLAGPSPQHPLGTDHLGRDVLSRLLFGGRNTLAAAFTGIALATLLGVSIGTVAGFYGGWLDEVCMRIVDILLALPTFILALVIAGMLGPGLWNVVAAMVLVRWAGLARVVRGQTLSLREQPYVEAARAVGASQRRIIFSHIWPNLIGPITVLVTLDLGSAILSIASFGFIGLGIQMPQPEWGAMLNEARIYIQKAPHLMLYPGLSISLTVLSANLLGDGLRDALDPQSARRLARKGPRAPRTEPC